MLNYTVPASDDAPIVDAGIDNQEIAKDTRITFPIPANAFDQVDIDDPITLAETPTQANGLTAAKLGDVHCRQWLGYLQWNAAGRMPPM